MCLGKNKNIEKKSPNRSFPPKFEKKYFFKKRSKSAGIRVFRALREKLILAREKKS